MFRERGEVFEGFRVRGLGCSGRGVWGVQGKG